MDIYVLNDKFESVKVIDDYISLIWTECYAKPGDFSLEVHAEDLAKYMLIPGYYLWRKETKVIMCIEYIRLNTDTVEGNTILVKGRSLESYLDRRVMMQRVTFDETIVRVAIETILNQNILNPTDAFRQAPLTIGEFPEEAETDVFSGDFQGETIVDVLEEICDTLGYGISLTLNQTTLIPHFRLYKGADRSWSQTENPWVVYSSKLDTLLTSEFVYDETDVGTAFVICGEEESQTINPSTGTVYNWPQVWLATQDDHVGWGRREVFIDGSSISRWHGDYILGTYDPKKPEDVTHGWKKLPEDWYKNLLLYKTETVREEAKTNTLKFEATGDHNVQWRLNEDIFLGDIVQVINEYGVGARCRISETTLSHDRNGIKFYPTFKALEDTIGIGGITWPSPSASTTRSTMIGCTTRPNS